MKTSILALVIVFGYSLFYVQESKAQTVVVQNNGTTTSQNTSRDPNIKYINGIPSTQDIGGVETTVVGSYDASVSFKNYHNFTVTVNYEINLEAEEPHMKMKRSGSLVIPSGESRTVYNVPHSALIREINTITRKL